MASDKDIELVKDGWPPPTADAAYMASFLRGMAKLRAIDAAYNQHAAAYLGTNRTQTGQMEDWMTRRDVLVGQAFERAGGVWNPMNPQTGAPMTAQEAAAYYFSRHNITPMDPGPGSSTTISTSDGAMINLQDLSTDELLRLTDQWGGNQ